MFSLPFRVERSIVINQPLDRVFKTLADFNEWRPWSPWLCQEPNCSVSITGPAGKIGHKQEWTGEIIGAGTNELVEIYDNHYLRFELTFLKPWKSQSNTAFEFSHHAGQTKVKWLMWGTLPAFLFFMRKSMQNWIGMDYERGLQMLKEYLEKGQVPTQVDSKGIEECEAFYYIGRRHKVELADIGPSMEKDFSELSELIRKGEVPGPDFVFAIYNKLNLAQQKCDYTAAFAYKKVPPQASVATGYKMGFIKSHRAWRVDHIGPYRFIGNAWSAAIGCQRSKNLKPSKKVPMYEIYSNDPSTVAESEIRTEIYIPLK